jgi:anti-sigma regulatory factor (Ser/Thr protein kinase)
VKTPLVGRSGETILTMELELLLTNDPRALPSVRALTAQTLAQLALPQIEARHLEALIVGAVGEALEHVYHAGEEAPIKLTIRETHDRLEMIVRDYGMPQDIELLERRLQKSEAAGATLFGCPIKLLDEVHWLGFGPEGNALQIRKWLRATDIVESSDAADLVRHYDDAPLAPQQEYAVRRMRPHEAVQVSQLMYRAYGNSYFNPDVYYPQRIAAQNAAGSIVSFVTCTGEGSIVGHYALELDQPGPVGEAGQAVIDLAHRGRGLLIRMKEAALEEARRRELVGCYADAVAVHTLTQQSNVHHGGHLTCVDLAGYPKTERFRGISEELPQRVTCLLYFHWLTPPQGRSVFVPSRHREMVSVIYRNLECPVEFGQSGEPSAGRGVLAVSVVPGAGSGVARVDRLGADTVEAVRHARRKLTERSGVEAVFAELPLEDSATPHVADELESLGFAFAGVVPHRSWRGDMLRLVYLVEPLAREPIKTYDEFAGRLVDYALAEQARVRAAV